MAKRAQKIDRQQARKSRRKGGKRRKGSAVAAHCIHCRQRPASPGHPFCAQCYSLPVCAGLDCRARVNLAGDLCPDCHYRVFGAPK